MRSSVEYIGTGTAQLALLPPSEVKGKTFKLIEYEATGKQLADVLTKVNGTSPKVTEVGASASPGLRFRSPKRISRSCMRAICFERSRRRSGRSGARSDSITSMLYRTTRRIGTGGAWKRFVRSSKKCLTSRTLDYACCDD